MPKIIDHDAYREELARRAVGLFSEYGYSGLGMRAIAEALGMSKSALYHYFPTKRDLFTACTAHATDWPMPETPPASAAQGLGALADQLKPVFAGEMMLIFDYLRGLSPDQIAQDPAMRLALDQFEARAAAVLPPGAGRTQIRAALALLVGGLMLDHFSGGTWDIGEITAILD